MANTDPVGTASSAVATTELTPAARIVRLTGALREILANIDAGVDDPRAALQQIRKIAENGLSVISRKPDGSKTAAAKLETGKARNCQVGFCDSCSQEVTIAFSVNDGRWIWFKCGGEARRARDLGILIEPQYANYDRDCYPTNEERHAAGVILMMENRGLFGPRLDAWHTRMDAALNRRSPPRHEWEGWREVEGKLPTAWARK